jgi:hypothetical protein
VQLETGSLSWARRLDAALGKSRPSAAAACEALRSRGFEIGASFERVTALYRQALEETRAKTSLAQALLLSPQPQPTIDHHSGQD